MLSNKIFGKKTIEVASVAILAAALSVGAVFGSTPVMNDTQVAEDTEATLYAGLMAEETAVVTVEQTATDIVSASEDEAALEVEAEVEPEVVYTEQEQEWMNYLMADVEDSLNVRAEADSEAEIVGKLRKGDKAEVVEAGETWTKITSGNVEGYVLNEYCVMGLDALAYANENVPTVATVTIDGLRIRKEASVDGPVVTAVAAGYELEVSKEAESTDEWVAVDYKDSVCYVSAEYVEIALDLGTGITLEEEEAIRKAEEEAARKAAQKNGSGSKQGSPVGASYDDVTLLAAIIMCEAGNCSYDGQLAVGCVVVNRIKSGVYPNTVYDVIYQSGQFGPVSSGKLANTLASGYIFGSCYSAAQEALSGVDNTDGAIGFAYASSGRAGVVYGNVVFFK